MRRSFSVARPIASATVRGRLLTPSGLQTDKAEISLLPSSDLEGDRRKDLKPIALGSLNARPDGVLGNIRIPWDALTPILQMLIAGPFKFVLRRASGFGVVARSYRDSSISTKLGETRVSPGSSPPGVSRNTTDVPSSLRTSPTPGARARSHSTGENPHEVALITEPADQRDICQRQFGSRHKALGLFDSELREILVGRNPCTAPETASEVARRQPALGSDMGDRQAAGKANTHDLLGPTLLPWRQSALVNTLTRAKIPVRLGKVREQCHTKLINEELIVTPLLL